MSKKHFVAFAAEIKKYVNSPGYENTAKHIADVVCAVSSRENPRFDKGRFLTACGFPKN